MPDPLHLYMLVAGMVLGIAFGPAVLGKAAPSLYDKLFVGTGNTTELDQAQTQLDLFRNDDSTRQERIANVLKQGEFLGEGGDTANLDVIAQTQALEAEFRQDEFNLLAQVEFAREPITQRREAHTEKLGGLATLLLLLTVVVMLAEPILAPSRHDLNEAGRAEVPAALPRLITLRYALVAGWVTLALAKPVWLLSIDPVFAIILAAVVGVAAFVPLGRSKPVAG